MNARASWVWCPTCRRDLNGDDQSFVSDDGDVVTYDCATCGRTSRWLFNAPVPLLLDEAQQTLAPASASSTSRDPEGRPAGDAGATSHE